MKIVIGIPAYNEEKNIAAILIKLKKISQHIIVCDDGSNDLTSKIAEGLGAIVVRHEKNLGYGAAIRSIFVKVKEMDADILVTFDADGQHRIEDIDKVIEPISENKADIVIGSRFLNKTDNVPKYRKIGIKVITELTNSITGAKITDSQSGFRAYNKNVIQKIHPTDYGMGVSTEILIKATKQKFRIFEVPIIVLYKGDTSTHHPVSHGISVILSTMKFISIERPLTFYGIPGFILFFMGLFFAIWTLQIFTTQNEVVTNIALIGIGGIVFGALMIFTSVILYSTVSVVRERN